MAVRGEVLRALGFWGSGFRVPDLWGHLTIYIKRWTPPPKKKNKIDARPKAIILIIRIPNKSVPDFGKPSCLIPKGNPPSVRSIGKH